MTQLNTQKAISLKSIGLAIPVGGGNFLGKTVAVVSGMVTGYAEKHTQFGVSIRLDGEFVTVNAITGEVFDASQIYMPSDFADAMVKKLENAEAGSRIGFENVEIVCSKSERAGRGYTYITRNFQNAQAINMKKEYAAKMLAELKALPAPEKTETKSNKKSA